MTSTTSGPTDTGCNWTRSPDTVCGLHGVAHGHARLSALRKRRDEAAEKLKDANRVLIDAMSHQRQAYHEWADADFNFIEACDEIGVDPKNEMRIR
jgi:hypothetical protein